MNPLIQAIIARLAAAQRPGMGAGAGGDAGRQAAAPGARAGAAVGGDIAAQGNRNTVQRGNQFAGLYEQAAFPDTPESMAALFPAGSGQEGLAPQTEQPYGGGSWTGYYDGLRRDPTYASGNTEDGTPFEMGGMNAYSPIQRWGLRGQEMPPELEQAIGMLMLRQYLGAGG